MKKLFTTLAACVIVSASSFGQAFFTQVPYQGAFPVNSSSSNWTSSWANFNPFNTAYPGDNGNNQGKVLKVITSGTIITNNRTWYADTTYVLDGQVYVGNGGILNIQPGTFIRAVKQPALAPTTYLVVAQGGKINAIGTPTKPIVFTSNLPTSSRSSGDWGGVMICGRARTNLAQPTAAGYQSLGVRRFEATATDAFTTYGSAPGSGFDTESSGALKYVRIEFAGDNALADQELNGLMLAGVGSGTSLDFIQVSYANDDSFEWFGGTANAKHLIAFGGSDDDFDMDEGFNGKLQFLLGIRDPASFDQSGTGSNNSNGFEIDNNTLPADNASHTSSNVNAVPQPFTNPTISNATIIGPLRNGEIAGTVSSKHGWGIRFRTGSNPAIFNSIFTGYVRGVNFTSRRPVGATYTVGATPNSFTRFMHDSATLKNCRVYQDVANTNGARFNFGTTNENNNAATAPFGPAASSFISPFENATATSRTIVQANSLYSSVAARAVFLARNGFVDSTSAATPATVGITAPYFTGVSTTTQFSYGGRSFAAINPSLIAATPAATGAAWADSRLNPLSLGNVTISTTQVPAAGTYDNITITGTGVANVNTAITVVSNIFVQNGAVLNLNAAISGQASIIVENGGTVVVNTSNPFLNTGGLALDFNSNLRYTVGGAIFNGVSLIGNLEIAAVGVTLPTAVTVNGTLKLTSGSLATGGNLTINSTPTLQGIVDDFTGTGTISGTVKFRRYTTNNFKHTASPLLGVIASQYLSPYTGTNANSLRSFSEGLNAWTNTSLVAAVPQLQSRMVCVVGQSGVIEFSGTVSGGIKTAILDRTSPATPGVPAGWNGLGNPYTTAISWSLVRNIAGNLNTSVTVTPNGASNLTAYVWNSSVNNYGILNNVGTSLANNANNLIAPGQGFLIRASADGQVFTLNKTVQSGSNAVTFLRQGASEGVVLSMTLANAEGSDEVMVNTAGESAEKIFSPVLTAAGMYIKGAEAMSVVSLKEITTETRLPLGVKNGGIVTVNSLNAPAGLTAYVVNSRNGKMQVIEAGMSFNATEKDQYAVVFRKGAAQGSSVYAYTTAAGIKVVLAGNENGSTIDVIDAAGKMVSRTAAVAGVAETTVVTPAMPGVYQIRVTGSANGITRVAAGLY